MQNGRAPVHTPYDGASRLFTIGVKPIDLRDWFEVDDMLDPYLAEKERLFHSIPHKVFVAEPETQSAQREVLDLMAAHLPTRYPDIYHRDGDDIVFRHSGRHVSLDTSASGPLKTASLLVQEDLILMRRSENGWRLAAGALCFPSSWSLEEKFGKPLQEIHDPVPGFGPGTRTADLINRIFDNMPANQAAQRMNWSLQAGDALYLPLSQVQRIDRATNRPSRFPGDDLAHAAFMRVERQTLRKLPVSGDILFTIRIYLDPIGVLKAHPDRIRIADSFAEQIGALDEAQLDYKGMTADRDRLISVLKAIAAGAS